MPKRRKNRRYKKRQTRTLQRSKLSRLRSRLLVDQIINQSTLRSVTRSQISPVKRKARKRRVIEKPITVKAPTRKSEPVYIEATPQDVRKALVCAGRKARKEVMHATKRAGKSGQKRPTNNKNRTIKC